MLSRLLPKSSHFRRLTQLPPKSHPYPHSHFPTNPYFSPLPKFFSSDNNSNSNDGKFDQSASTPWNISRQSEGKFDQLFTQESGDLAGISPAGEDDESRLRASEEKTRGEAEWATAEGYKPWSLVEEEDKDDVFGLKEEEVGETGGESSTSTTSGGDDAEKERSEEASRLEREEQELTAILKGTSMTSTLFQHNLRDNNFLLFVILNYQFVCICFYFLFFLVCDIKLRWGG
jgi:small subunit ribosomal protein S9